MIGVERGWRLRGEAPGTRVAGVRTFTLLGGGGGLAALLGALISPAVTILLVLALSGGLVMAYWREPKSRDSTSFVAAIVALALGLLAGAGEPALAIAAAAVVTLVLATREQSHGLIDRLNRNDVRAFSRYAVIAAAVLPFLPNRSMGPLDAWNPFQLWLVVVLVTGFSFAGYVANRTVGARKGVLATALIGGAYSSTAVTASLSRPLGRGEPGPFTAGILLASAIMYVRVLVLVAILSPSTLPQFLVTVGPAATVGLLLALLAWRRAPPPENSKAATPGNPIELLPAFGFVAIVAVAAVVTRWAQARFGEAGIATSLFLTGSFDVDAAIVTLSGLPVEAIDRRLAAAALGGTIVANMLLKILVTAAYARQKGRTAVAGLAASTLLLAVTIGSRLLVG
jgi:uncharacterized membrane protein (DUF4010 family)